MTLWEYKALEHILAEKWSAKGHAEQMKMLEGKMNRMGKDGWELISYESVPMFGTISQKLKGYIYMLMFKRPLEH